MKPEPEATHRCKVCGALWRLNEPTKVQPGGSWSLVYPFKAGQCCDNVAMGDQIERIGRSANEPVPQPAEQPKTWNTAAYCGHCPHLLAAHVYFLDLGYQCQAPDCACVVQ